MTWLEKLLSQHNELESPMRFWLWGGLAAISAVVKDSVWLHRQIHNLYPNIYVMFHAESGLKKGPPISMAKQLVAKTGVTRIISGRSSIQGILKELGTAHTQEGKGGKVDMKSTAFICSSELTSSIVEDKVATDILTDLYDRQYNMGEWRSLLKMESFNLKDPTISMLTATNDAHSTDFFGKKDIHGGYFARTFIIAEHKRNRANSLLVPLVNPPNYEEMCQYLKELAKLRGAFEPLASRDKTESCVVDYSNGNGIVYYTPAGVAYEKWYAEFLEQIAEQDQKDDTGTLNRFGDSVLKVAMLLSLAKSPNLIIDEESMMEAIEHCRRLVGSVREMTYGKRGLSDAKNIKDLIIKELFNRPTHQISRMLLLKKMWMNYKEANELDEIMFAFDQSGMIKTDSIGNQIVYSMPEKQVAELTRYYGGRNK